MMNVIRERSNCFGCAYVVSTHKSDEECERELELEIEQEEEDEIVIPRTELNTKIAWNYRSVFTAAAVE